MVSVMSITAFVQIALIRGGPLDPTQSGQRARNLVVSS
jgi:hypothetical protein